VGRGWPYKPWMQKAAPVPVGAGEGRRCPSTRASLTLCRDIFAQVLAIAEREKSSAVPLLRRTVADLDQQLLLIDGPLAGEPGYERRTPDSPMCPHGLTYRDHGCEQSDGSPDGS
jgi:hypothetical protein